MEQRVFFVLIFVFLLVSAAGAVAALRAKSGRMRFVGIAVTGLAGVAFCWSVVANSLLLLIVSTIVFVLSGLLFSVRRRSSTH